MATQTDRDIEQMTIQINTENRAARKASLETIAAGKMVATVRHITASGGTESSIQFVQTKPNINHILDRAECNLCLLFCNGL